MAEKNEGTTYTWRNLVQPDVDIVISVHAGLFMVKSQSMEQLMLNHCLVVTAWSQWQDLTCLLVTNTREAPMGEEAFDNKL